MRRSGLCARVRITAPVSLAMAGVPIHGGLGSGRWLPRVGGLHHRYEWRQAACAARMQFWRDTAYHVPSATNVPTWSSPMQFWRDTAYHVPSATNVPTWSSPETDFLDQPANIAADLWTPGHRPTERAAIVPQPLARR